MMSTRSGNRGVDLQVGPIILEAELNTREEILYNKRSYNKNLGCCLEPDHEVSFSIRDTVQGEQASLARR